MKESIHDMPSLQNAKKRTRAPIVFSREDLVISSRLREFARGKRYFIRTYGCQANVVDSETIAGILEEIGFVSSNQMEDSDVILLNTCAVRENAEDKVFGEVGALKNLFSKNSKKVLGICGCMAQEPHVVESIRKHYPQVNLIFGTHNIKHFAQLLDEVLFENKKVIEVSSCEGEVIENLPKIQLEQYKAFVNIMYGCDKFCTYCIVPYTRGKQRSRLKEDILKEIIDLKEKGYKEVTLLGQNVNAYGKDFHNEESFATLLEEVAKTDIERIRFTTSHPWDFDESMIEVMAKYKNIMPFLHLPLQSGSNEILRKMGRRYTIESYLELVDKLRKAIPNIALSTDIIVGFPEESEEDFLCTLEAVKKCQYDSAFTFIYSPRIGTPAAKMNDSVSRVTKGERFHRLVTTLEESIAKKAQAYVGKIVSVLVDGPSKKDESMYSGYNEQNKLVHFKGTPDLIGKIIPVRILESHTYSLIGEVVHE